MRLVFRARCVVQFRFTKACKYSKSTFSKQLMISNYSVVGELAQMVERLLSMQEVLGSMPRFFSVFFFLAISSLFWCRYFSIFSILFYSILALQCTCTEGLQLVCLPMCTGSHVTLTERAISEDHGYVVWYRP